MRRGTATANNSGNNDGLQMRRKLAVLDLLHVILGQVSERTQGDKVDTRPVHLSFRDAAEGPGEGGTGQEGERTGRKTGTARTGAGRTPQAKFFTIW